MKRIIKFMERDLPLFGSLLSVDTQISSVLGQGSAHRIEFSDNPVADIVSLVPEIEGFSLPLKDRANEFIETKLDKLALKIKLSPYIPYDLVDPFGLNQNFSKALCQWLHQFPESRRLGFLAAALSTIYLSAAETNLFLDIGIQRLAEAIVEEAAPHALMSHTIPTDVKGRIRLLPVSSFNDYDNLIHKLQLDGNRDSDKQLVRGLLDEFISKSYNDLRVLAEHDEDFFYYRKHAGNIERAINSLLNSHVVLVEDSSFSGTRISKNIKRFLMLLNILFGRFEKKLENVGEKIPRVYLLVPFGTNTAQEAVLPDKFSFYPHFNSVFGFTFDENNSATKRLPETIDGFGDLFTSKETLYEKLRGAVDFFHKHYGESYWARETNNPYAEVADNRFGFAAGGWTIVPHRNCPNNSLPLLWYPHTSSQNTEIKALFTRVESRNSHASHRTNPKDGMKDVVDAKDNAPSNNLEDDMRVVSEDKKHLLNRFLTNLFKRYC
jgi:hypothetical protein